MGTFAREELQHWGAKRMPPGTFVYEVYPRSFQATGNSGTGTINGIRNRLAYLESLGVEVIWLTPIFPSPMHDFGYDVSDYCNVNELFGRLADLDALVAEAAWLGIRIMLDFVANHTSSEHPWFKESRSSLNNPKRDWYIWRDPAKDGGPPNNWLAVFGGPAWQFDENTGQYYLHSFLPEQPDLNWESSEVQKAMQDVLRFWARRGISLWRVDAMDWTGKDFQQFRNNPPNPNYKPGPGADPYDAQLHVYTRHMPNHLDYLNVLGDALREFDGFMIVETYPPGKNLAAEYRRIFDNYPTSQAAPLLLLPLIYQPFTAASLANVHSILAIMQPGETPVWITGTHDVSRTASRLPDPKAARLMLMLLMLLPGARVMYYGEEIGMLDGVIPPDRVQDPFELRVPGRGLGRDPNRTPMQWSSQHNAGFSQTEPWLPVASNHTTLNVASQEDDPQSTLALTHALLKLVRNADAFVRGSYEPLILDGDVFGFARTLGGERYLVLLNISDHTVRCSASTNCIPCTFVMSSGLSLPASLPINPTCIELGPWEGYVIKA